MALGIADYLFLKLLKNEIYSFSWSQQAHINGGIGLRLGGSGIFKNDLVQPLYIVLCDPV